MPPIDGWKTGVYGIRHKTGGKIYVGSCSKKAGIKARWVQHVRELNKGEHHSRYLQRAWDKHGEDAFEFVVLEACSPRRCLEREQWWMDHYQCYEAEYGYNMSRVAGNCTGVKHSEVTRAKIGAAIKGKKQTPEWIKERTKGQKGSKRSPESCARISAAAIKRWETEDREAWSKMQKARVLSEEAKEAMSAGWRSQVGKEKPEGARAKIRAYWCSPEGLAVKARMASEEARAKNSAALREAWKDSNKRVSMLLGAEKRRRGMRQLWLFYD